MATAGEIVTLYGLCVRSEIRLARGLDGVPAGSVEPDVEIRLGEVPEDGIEGAEPTGAFCQVMPGVVWLSVPRVARFLIREGRSVRVAPDPEVDEETLALYLRGNALGALLHQRGKLVLHGTVVANQDHVIAICGRSGSGKSTLAADLLRTGDFRLVSDDLCVLDEAGVHPGVPELELWRDAVATLDVPRDELTQVRPGVEKYAWDVSHRFRRRPAGLDAIYILGSDNLAPEPTIETVSGMRRFMPLKRNVYRSSVVEPLGLARSQLGMIARFLGDVKLRRVNRALERLTPESLEAVTRLILDDLGEGEHAA